MTPMHPSTLNALAAMDFRHLPNNLRPLAEKFARLAFDVAENPAINGPDMTAAINRLREAKDLAVGAVARAGTIPEQTVANMRIELSIPSAG